MLPLSLLFHEKQKAALLQSASTLRLLDTPDDLLWGSRVSSDEHPAPHPELTKLTKTRQHLVSVFSYLKTRSNTSNKSTSAILLPQNTVGVGFGNTHSLETINPSIQCLLEHSLHIQRCLGFGFKPAASKLIQHLSP